MEAGMHEVQSSVYASGSSTSVYYIAFGTADDDVMRSLKQNSKKLDTLCPLKYAGASSGLLSGAVDASIVYFSLEYHLQPFSNKQCAL
eukprot:11130760-Ditylum_brightwellii.AAC.1